MNKSQVEAYGTTAHNFEITNHAYWGEKARIINFKSEPKNNPFAPEWNYVLTETIIKDVDFLSLAKFFKNKEKSILKLKTTTDGFTGLDSNSTTVRHENYNVFNWKNKELNKLKKNIVELHNSFLKKLNIKVSNTLFIKCWVNIMKKNEQIKKHIHGFHPNIYLGGHICISCNGTSTYYINPVNQINNPYTYRSQNTIGKLTLFQNCIPHYTDIHQSDEKRITLAFDLSLVKGVGYIKLI
tara:strand:+ start:74 stop:793 length:720 start_codon:yes stop_codon:yes gene_type:complete